MLHEIDLDMSGNGQEVNMRTFVYGNWFSPPQIMWQRSLRSTIDEPLRITNLEHDYDFDPLNLPAAADGWTAVWLPETDPTDPADYYTRETPYFYHQNTLFSVVALTDAAGKRVEGYVYDPYGQHLTFTDANADGVITFSLSTDTVTPMAPSAFKNPYTFTGRRLDAETGLLYYRNRMYSTSRGRFLSRDPMISYYSFYENYSFEYFVDKYIMTAFGPKGSYSEIGENLRTREKAEELVIDLSLHLYLYTRSAPSNYQDPLGLMTSKADAQCKILISKGQLPSIKDSVMKSLAGKLYLPTWKNYLKRKCLETTMEKGKVICQTNSIPAGRDNKCCSNPDKPLAMTFASHVTYVCYDFCRIKKCTKINDMKNILLHEFAHRCGMPDEGNWPGGGNTAPSPWDISKVPATTTKGVYACTGK